MKWPSWLYRLVPYLGRRQAEEDLQEELRLHLELERDHGVLLRPLPYPDAGAVVRIGESSGMIRVAPPHVGHVLLEQRQHGSDHCRARRRS